VKEERKVPRRLPAAAAPPTKYSVGRDSSVQKHLVSKGYFSTNDSVGRDISAQNIRFVPP
jgi:hypothetical protein